METNIYLTIQTLLQNVGLGYSVFGYLGVSLLATFLTILIVMLPFLVILSIFRRALR